MIKCVIPLLEGFIFFPLDDGERVLKMEMRKKTPKVLTGHMVNRDAINRENTEKS